MIDDTTSETSTRRSPSQPNQSQTQNLDSTLVHSNLDQTQIHTEDLNLHNLTQFQKEVTLLRKDLSTLMEKLKIATNSKEVIAETRKWHLFTDELPPDSTFASLESLLRTVQLSPTSISITHKNGQPMAFINLICSTEPIKSLLNPSRETNLPRFQLAWRHPWRKTRSDPHKLMENSYNKDHMNYLGTPVSLSRSSRPKHPPFQEESLLEDTLPKKAVPHWQEYSCIQLFP